MSFDAVEQAIVTRLTEKLGSLVKKVYTAAEIAQIEEAAQLCPFVAVIYDGYVPVIGTNGSMGKVQSIDKAWVIVVGARNAAATHLRGGAKLEAAPIIDGVFSALLGWRPPIEGEMPLQLTDAPGASFYDAGFAGYPIRFINRRVHRGID